MDTEVNRLYMRVIGALDVMYESPYFLETRVMLLGAVRDRAVELIEKLNELERLRHEATTDERR